MKIYLCQLSGKETFHRIKKLSYAREDEIQTPLCSLNVINTFSYFTITYIILLYKHTTIKKKQSNFWYSYYNSQNFFESHFTLMLFVVFFNYILLQISAMLLVSVNGITKSHFNRTPRYGINPFRGWYCKMKSPYGGA